MVSPHDPTVLDLNGCHADVAWLRACGITNVPDRLETLLKDHARLADELAATREVLEQADAEIRWLNAGGEFL